MPSFYGIFASCASWAMSYASFAFILVEWDFRLWTFEARLTFIVISFIGWLAMLIYRPRNQNW